ncbi:MAG: hypothetical protein GC200_08075 [Tepidisphaera sp.]|nr:hypothetical protein [Tepidisphaera sp.]
MRVAPSLVRLGSLAGSLALGGVVLAQTVSTGGQVDSVRTTRSTGVVATAASVCAGGSYVASPLVEDSLLLADAAGDTSGVYVTTDEQVVAADLPAGNDAIGTVTWTIARGTLPLADQSPQTAGLVISNVHLVDGDGVATDISIASVVADDAASGAIEQVRGSKGVEVVPAAEATAARSLGSSCSCPACPLGGRFWAPFIVIGVGGSPAGQACCTATCDAGCLALHNGHTGLDAWLIGQGARVTCMLCN